MSWYSKLQEKSRDAKFECFMYSFNITPETRILDLGAGTGSYLEKRLRGYNVSAVDISEKNLGVLKEKYPEVPVFLADAADLPFKKDSFDVVFCNAVIEHLPENMQREMAFEIMRVGKAWFVATPNKWFPFEFHYRLPLFQFLPRSWRKWLAERVALGNYRKGEWEEINLLSKRDLETYFFGSNVFGQSVSGLMDETLIVVGGDAR